MGRPRKLQQMKERSFSFTPFGSQRSRNLAKVARCRAKSSGVPGKSIFSAVLKGVECRAKVKTAPMFVKTKALFIKTLLMLVPLAWKDQLFQLFTEIPVIVKYSQHAILDDVGHKRSILILLSTFK